MSDDPTEGSWTPDWVRDAVFYQIFPDRFAHSARIVPPGPLEPWDAPPTFHGIKGGDLYGIVEHLDHIQDLGATALYLNPIFQSASNHRYHTYDYQHVDPLLGGDAALRELLDACHARGMRVVLDGVFNHASRGFWPFHHVLETGLASPYVDWFFFDRDALATGRPVRAYVNEPGPPGETDEGLLRLGYRAWWGLPALPKLNTNEPTLRAHLLDIAEHWIRFGADGWRLDVAEEVPDDFWRAFRTRVKATNPDAYIVAEIWDERPDALQGDRYDALMNYPLGAAITSFVGAGRLDRRVLAQQQNLAASVRDEDAGTFAARLDRALAMPFGVVAAQLNLVDSHDTPRFRSMVGDDIGGLRLALLLLMTLPGAPSLYYGDEIGMSGEGDPANRGAFPWDHPQTWDRDLLAFVRGAIAMRHAQPVLRRGWCSILAAEGSVIVLRRTLGDATAVIVVNAGDGPAQVTVELPDRDGWTFGVQRWPSGPTGLDGDDRTVAEGRLTLDVAARDGGVLLAG
jgi:cyclomaltodextrinase